MKHLKLLILSFSVYFLVSCSSPIKETIGGSDKYSEDDIRSAMSVVKKDYNNFVKIAKPISLTFSNSNSELIERTFLPTLSSYKSQKHEDIIVLNSDIKTNLFSGSLSPLTTYSNFYWILKRNGSNWTIIYGNFLN
ncbi:hypothetical protein ACWOC1_11185 [Enterococcus quebecensis]|uniref:DUF4829 domain-containing protein n=1 Tax=Enterococcus quebecensis TaxID=903983 RepID=A0A1E5GTE9_9ENTE|nr:hypothetical protein [Enterococcus quebecensis]OEG15971.1 hypothetical protein BCR23_07440 [Enterococcus quebecensis]